MKKEPTRKKPTLQAEIEALRLRLAEAEETLRAIREGEVDAVVVSGTKGEQIFSLVSADSNYRVIVETMQEAALTVTFDGTILFCNAQFGKLVKRPLELVVGHPLHEFVDESQRASAASSLLAAQQAPVKQRLVFQDSNGTGIPAFVSANVLNQPDGCSICIVANDLTELENSTELVQQLRRQQETLQAANEELAAAEEELLVQNDELRASRAEADRLRARYADLFETAPDGYLSTDPEGTIQEVNRAAARLFSRPAAELKGNPFSSLLPAAQWNAYLRIMEAIQAGTSPLPDCEIEIQPAGAPHFWAAITAAASRDDEGRIVGLRWLVRDITERMRAEGALQEQRRQLKLAMAAGKLVPWVIDLVGNGVEPSPALLELFGLEQNAAVAGRAEWRKPIYEDDRQKIHDSVEASKTGQEHHLEYRIRHPDGTIHWHETHGVPVPDASGRYVRLVGYVRDVTDRKRAEDALRESERRLRLQFERMPIGYIIYDERNCFCQMNPAAERIFGYSQAELLGKHANVIVPEDGRAGVDGILRRLSAGDMTAHNVNENLTKDGRIVVCQWTNTPLRDDAGAFVGFLSMVQDITERKQAEETLAVTQRQIQGIIDNTPAIVYAFDLEERFVLANATVAELLNSTPEQMIGKRRHEFMPQADADWHEANDRKVIDAGRALEFEEASQLPDHSITWLTTKFPLRDAQGRIYAVAGISTDVSSRKQAEESLRQRAEEVERLLEVVPVAVWVAHDEQCLSITGNRRANEFYEASGGENVSASTLPEVRRFFTPDGRELTPGELPMQLAATTNQDVLDTELHVVLPSGRRIAMLGSAVPLRNEDQQVRGVIGAFLDITERKRAEEALQASLHEKEVLLKEVHHRVKNNMQVLSSLVSLQADTIEDPALRELFGDLRDRVRTMALVHEKLYQSDNLARVDFAEYVRSLLDYLWRAHGNTAEAVRLTLDMQPVEFSVRTSVPCGLILNELVTNALKHAFRDRTDGELAVALHADADGTIRLGVSDNGGGFPAGMDWRHTRSLGLQLVQMLVGQLGGTVSMRQNNGTAFDIAFRYPTQESDEQHQHA